MRWEERQERVQEKIDEAIDHLAEEFSLNVNHYPVVIWVGRKDFKELKLPVDELANFEALKRNKVSATYPNGLILIANHSSDNIVEEATHFLHFSNSGIRNYETRGYDGVCLDILTEALGFFGSKVIDPSIKNNGKTNQENGIVKNYVYKRGYALGEIMFYSYIQGEICRRFVRDLFQNPLDRHGSAKRKLRQLESRFVH